MDATRTNNTRWILYLRLSDLRLEDMDEDGDGKTFAAREEKLRERVGQLGGTVVDVIIENDVNRKTGKARPASAFKRKKVQLPDGSHGLRVVRPGFRRMLDMLATGTATGVLAEDLDRCVRDPRDLEDLIDVAQANRINARSLAGSLTFTDGGTDAEITMARMMVTMANKSSRDTARRVAEERERQALSGRFGGGGTRPFGFEADGVTRRESECDIVAEMSTRILQLDAKTGRPTSLRMLNRELRERDIPTVTGVPWTTFVLRNVLLRARNAGIMVHRGQEVGPAPWKPIVEEDTFRAVERLLTNPQRRLSGSSSKTAVGTSAKTLGTGLYRCGICGDGTTLDVKQGRYSCSAVKQGGKHHLGRNEAAVDRYVQANLLTHIINGGADQFVDSIVERPDINVAELRSEANSIRVRLDAFAEDYAEGLIDRPQMLRGTAKSKERIAEIDQLLASVVVDTPVRSLVEAAQGGTDETVREVWLAQPLATKRAIVRDLVTVTIHRAVKRGRGVFDPDAIQIDWKNPLPDA